MDIGVAGGLAGQALTGPIFNTWRAKRAVLLCLTIIKTTATPMMEQNWTQGGILLLQYQLDPCRDLSTKTSLSR